MAALTQKQKQVLEFCQDFQRINGFMPTVRQVAEAIGISSNSTVQHHLNELERKNFIVRMRQRFQNLRGTNHAIPRTAAQFPKSDPSPQEIQSSYYGLCRLLNSYANVYPDLVAQAKPYMDLRPADSPDISTPESNTEKEV